MNERISNWWKSLFVSFALHEYSFVFVIAQSIQLQRYFEKSRGSLFEHFITIELCYNLCYNWIFYFLVIGLRKLTLQMTQEKSYKIDLTNDIKKLLIFFKPRTLRFQIQKNNLWEKNG